MKVWIVSDLHVNAHRWSPEIIPEHDLMVVAGDICDGQEQALAELFALRQRTRRPILFVPGNHDVAGGAIDGFAARLSEPIYVLPAGEHVFVAGVRFIGATLWTDWGYGDLEWQAQSWAARNMPEYQSVLKADGSDMIWPIHTSNAHDVHRAAIERVLASPFGGPIVVVTHHAPSGRSLHWGDRLHESAAAFASDLEPLIKQHQPALWMHGHIHAAADYKIGSTRVICNPRGYQRAGWSEETGWREDLVVHL